LRRLGRALLPAAALLVLAPATSADVVIVANPGLGVSTIDTETLRRIYLGQQTRLGDVAIVPALLRKEPMNSQFSERYLDRTANQFTTYWRSRIFSGKGLPPRAFDSVAELLAFVRATPGAVAFVDSSASLGGVQVLEIRR
jgi:hypothetical protein